MLRSACCVMQQQDEQAVRQSTEERIQCVCSVTSDTPDAEDYDGLWVQCDKCNAWLHGSCVGFAKRAPTGTISALLAAPTVRSIVPCSLCSEMYLFGY